MNRPIGTLTATDSANAVCDRMGFIGRSCVSLAIFLTMATCSNRSRVYLDCADLANREALVTATPSGSEKAKRARVGLPVLCIGEKVECAEPMFVDIRGEDERQLESRDPAWTTDRQLLSAGTAARTSGARWPPDPDRHLFSFWFVPKHPGTVRVRLVCKQEPIAATLISADCSQPETMGDLVMIYTSAPECLRNFNGNDQTLGSHSLREGRIEGAGAKNCDKLLEGHIPMDPEGAQALYQAARQGDIMYGMAHTRAISKMMRAAGCSEAQVEARLKQP